MFIGTEIDEEADKTIKTNRKIDMNIHFNFLKKRRKIKRKQQKTNKYV